MNNNAHHPPEELESLNNESETGAIDQKPDLFPVTWWSMVHGAGRANPEALELLCAKYRKPLLALANYHSRGHRDAEDFVQTFMLKIFSPEILATMDPQEGKFRSFLFKCLTRHIRDEKNKIHDERYVDPPDETSAGQHESVFVEPAARKIFDREVALQVIASTMEALRNQHLERGQLKRFDALKPLLAGKDADLPQEEVAASLGISRAAVAKGVFDMRKEFRVLFRREVARIVRNIDEVDAEMAYLLEAMCD